MTRILWDVTRPYEAGLDRGVLYLADGSGVVWNGLTAVDETGNTTADTFLYLDGIRRIIHQRREDTKFKVEALTYPTQFDDYVGGQGLFGFSYRTMTDVGYQIHMVYNVVATISGRDAKTQSRAVDISTFKWLFAGKSAGQINGSAPSAHLTADSTTTSPTVLAALENILYGSSTTAPRLPTFVELINLYQANPRLTVVDNGDGTWTATVPDSAFRMIDANTFEIDWPMAQYTDADTYTLETS